MIRRLALFAALLSIATACSGDGDEQTNRGNEAPPVEEIALREGVHSRILEGSLDIEVRGAVEFSWSGSTPLNVLTNVGAGSPEAFWQLTIGIMPEHIVDADGTRFRTAFDLLGYRGSGEYTLEAATPEGSPTPTPDDDAAGEEQPPAPGSLRGAALLLVAPPGVEEPDRFNELEEPCTIEVRDRGHSGTVDCPAVSGDDGDVAFTWSWETDPDALIETLAPGRDPTATPEPGNERTGNGDEGSGSTPKATEGNAESGGDGSDSDAEPPTGIQADFPLEVTVDPDDCATAGTPVNVRVDTTPNADVTMTMAYSDAKSHGNAITGSAGPEGSFPWEFVVPPEAPDGQARLLVQVVTADGEQRGGGILEVFTVQPSC